MLSEKVSQKSRKILTILFYISIPETSKIGSRKNHSGCLKIAETKGFSVILRIPKICGREMEAKPVFSGAKSALSIQNDPKTRFLVSPPPPHGSPGSVCYFHPVIFRKSISLKMVAGGSHFFPDVWSTIWTY